MKILKSKIVLLLAIFTILGVTFYNIQASLKAQASYIPTQSVAHWVKITKFYTDFATAGATNAITVYTLPAKTSILGSQAYVQVPFAGGTIATYTISVETDGAIPIHQAVNAFTGNTFSGSVTPIQLVGSMTGNTTITATGVSTVGLLNAATAGTVEIYLLISEMP